MDWPIAALFKHFNDGNPNFDYTALERTNDMVGFEVDH